MMDEIIKGLPAVMLFLVSMFLAYEFSTDIAITAKTQYTYHSKIATELGNTDKKIADIKAQIADLQTKVSSMKSVPAYGGLEAELQSVEAKQSDLDVRLKRFESLSIDKPDKAIGMAILDERQADLRDQFKDNKEQTATHLDSLAARIDSLQQEIMGTVLALFGVIAAVAIQLWLGRRNRRDTGGG